MKKLLSKKGATYSFFDYPKSSLQDFMVIKKVTKDIEHNITLKKK